MNVIEYSTSIISILPPIIALLMAVLTRRVLLSLTCGIVVGSLLLAGGALSTFVIYLLQLAKNLFWGSGHFNYDHIYILFFLLLLGGMTGLMQINGATKAFGIWAQRRIKTQRGASLLTAFLCFVVFIDDYFHSLAVGSIARPVTDHAQISRAKLAYLLDSTAAPMCVIMPISSWGAYIIGEIGDILVKHHMELGSPLSAFVEMIPLNFYAVFALITAFIVAYFNINIGSMRGHEARAKDGYLFDESKGQPAGSDNKLTDEIMGSPIGLLLPLFILALATFSSFFITGYLQVMVQSIPLTIFSILKNAQVTISLVMGGMAGLVTAIIYNLVSHISGRSLVLTVARGGQSMFGAILVLLFAWAIADVIHDMQTGTYLASIVEQSHLSAHWLLVILFAIAGIMAFATGTSWGTFGVMLPMAGDIVAQTAPELMLPALAAVLAGSVFGDHCSPISDTTILSSTGAGSHHIDHVVTQLPYALFTALIAAIAYLILGWTHHLSLALGGGLLLLLVGLCILHYRTRQLTDRITLA